MKVIKDLEVIVSGIWGIFERFLSFIVWRGMLWVLKDYFVWFQKEDLKLMSGDYMDIDLGLKLGGDFSNENWLDGLFCEFFKEL